MEWVGAFVPDSSIEDGCGCCSIYLRGRSHNPHDNTHVKYDSIYPSECSLRPHVTSKHVFVSSGLGWRVKGLHVTESARSRNDGASLLHMDKQDAHSLSQSPSKNNLSSAISILLPVPATRRSLSPSTPPVSFHLALSACPHRTVAPIPCRISTPDPWHHGAEALPEAPVSRIPEVLLANLKPPRPQTRRRCNSTMPLTNRANWAT
jgi:hypothetical protein